MDLNPSTGSTFQEREKRISKENLYMVLALWMEEFQTKEQMLCGPPSASQAFGNPEDQTSSNSKASSEQIPNETHSTIFNKVGVVFVLPNDRVLSADCSRDEVHGVARVIMKHGDKVEGCKVYVSRKPCSMCAKLLVQARVSKVLYLPIEPERVNEKDDDINDKVDHLFRVSNVAQSVFVPHVEESVQRKHDRKRPPNTTPDEVHECKKKLMEKWWNDEKILQWPALNNEIKIQTKNDFASLMTWIASIKAPIDKSCRFSEVINGDPLPINDTKYYKHVVIFAKMLSYQTDDPKSGVGAVLMNDDEIIGLGWNGYPSKVLYGELPRASDDDYDVKKKYPYVIHAEQNALMSRNEKNIKEGILIVTKCPCDECAPLVKLSGVSKVVVGERIDKSKGGVLSYKKFKEYVYSTNKEVTCYQMSNEIPASESKRKKLRYDKQ